MKLTDVISIWDILHEKRTGDLGYNDLQDAIEEVVGIENDISQKQPECSCTSQNRDLDCPTHGDENTITRG
jgi:hypothetical protein